MTPPLVRWLHNREDVAAAIADNPPDFPGWAFLAATQGPDGVILTYEDDDLAQVTFVLGVTLVDLDERRVRPEPPEREKGDDGKC